MVERFAQGIAPMTVVRSDGGGKSVRFRFADKSGSVGVHDVLQDTRTGVVARNEEHPVRGHLWGLLFGSFFPHCIILGFLFFVCFHLYGHFFADLVVDRFYE